MCQNGRAAEQTVHSCWQRLHLQLASPVQCRNESRVYSQALLCRVAAGQQPYLAIVFCLCRRQGFWCAAGGENAMSTCSASTATNRAGASAVQCACRTVLGAQPTIQALATNVLPRGRGAALRGGTPAWRPAGQGSSPACPKCSRCEQTAPCQGWSWAPCWGGGLMVGSTR